MRRASGWSEKMGLLDKFRGRASSSVTDAVCGMKVDPLKAAGMSQHGGETHYFCSRTCKQRFDADPTEILRSRIG